MWKIFCFVALTSIATITAGNVVLGGLIDPELPVPFSLSLVNKCAKIAREVVHSANQTWISTIAAKKPLKGYPILTEAKVADSTINGSSTGDITFYLQKSEPMYANIVKKNEVSAMFINETKEFNNATSEWDTIQNKVLITGYVAQIPLNTTEGNKTEAALLSRHPDLEVKRVRLNTVLAKLVVDQVCIIDEVQGYFCVTADDYYNADVDE